VDPVPDPLLLRKSGSVGVNELEREAEHSPPSNAEVKDAGAVSLLHNTDPWNSTSLIKHRYQNW
jgi:hypothetical protein